MLRKSGNEKYILWVDFIYQRKKDANRWEIGLIFLPPPPPPQGDPNVAGGKVSYIIICRIYQIEPNTAIKLTR